MRAAWWWIDRWRTSSAYASLSMAEQGAYRNLLDELWLRDGPIPNDERTLERCSGAGSEWKSLRENVMRHFRLTDSGWVNDTQSEVAQKSAEFRQAQSEKGRTRAAKASRGPAGTFQPSQPDHQPEVQPTIQPSNQPLSLSLDLSLDPSPITKIPPSTEDRTLPPKGAGSPKRKPDACAVALKNILGSGMKVALDQIRALRSAGWTDDRIHEAIGAHALPGISPWEWTRLATGSSAANGKRPGGGMTVREILDYGSKP